MKICVPSFELRTILICVRGLFNNAVSILVYVTPSIRMTDELGRIWKVAVVAWSRHLRRTKKNMKNSWVCTTWQSFEQGISRIKVLSFTATPPCSKLRILILWLFDRCLLHKVLRETYKIAIIYSLALLLVGTVTRHRYSISLTEHQCVTGTHRVIQKTRNSACNS
jgi:hypothetical protein